MLDVQLLRSDLADTAKRLAERGYTLDAGAFEALEARRKAVQTETQELQANRNRLSKEIGQLKAKKEDTTQLMAQVNAQAERLKALEEELESIRGKLDEFLLGIPNVPHATVPTGRSSDENAELRKEGVPRNFGFPVKDHVDLGEG